MVLISEKNISKKEVNSLEKLKEKTSAEQTVPIFPAVCISSSFEAPSARKMADRAFSRNGMNEKFSRQFCHNCPKELIVDKSVVSWTIIFGVRWRDVPLRISVAPTPVWWKMQSRIDLGYAR